MKNRIICLLLLSLSTIIVSQNNVKAGDTIYYQNNKFSYYKTDTFVVLKKKVIASDINHFLVEKYQFDTVSKKSILESKFPTFGLSELRSHGTYVEYYKTGEKLLEGETTNGARNPDELWTYFYKNGNKKSQEKLSDSKKIKYPLIINFWNENGVQTIFDGNGIYEFENENGFVLKGNLKEGLRVGNWTASRNNKTIYTETYKKGKFVKGVSYDENGKKYNYKNINVPATFKTGGVGAVRKYVINNFSENIASSRGSMVVWFTVDKKGKTSNIRIVQRLTNSYNQEVERIISNMRNGWKPAKLRGIPVDYTYKLSLNFK